MLHLSYLLISVCLRDVHLRKTRGQRCMVKICNTCFIWTLLTSLLLQVFVPIMASCVSYGCVNRSSRKTMKQLLSEDEKKITFHRFPKDESRRLLWIKAVRRKNWEPSAHSVLCSSHFTEECFDRTSLCCVRLRENAIPTIFPGFPSYLQQALKRQQNLRQLKTRIACAISEQLSQDEAPDNKNKTLNADSRCTRSTSVSPDHIMKCPQENVLQSTILTVKKQYVAKIKRLQQRNRRLCKKVVDLKNVIKVVKEKSSNI